MDTKYIIGFVIAIVLIVGGIAMVSSNNNNSTVVSPYDLDTFATCLKDKGAQFYGAFWCPHCQNTKKMFGSAANKLPYVECSTPDTKGQLQVCTDKGIARYPTWTFADGTKVEGVLSFEELSERTGCPLIPVGGAATSTSPVATSTATTSAVQSSTSTPR